MTLPVFAVQRPSVAVEFVPASGNLLTGIIEAAWDDAIQAWIWGRNLCQDFLTRMWEEVLTDLSALFQRRTRLAH